MREEPLNSAFRLSPDAEEVPGPRSTEQAPPSTVLAQNRPAGRRHRRRLVRCGGLGWSVQLIEPPLQRAIASIARRRRRRLHAVCLIGRATKPDMHMRRVPIPGSDQVQPRSISVTSRQSCRLIAGLTKIRSTSGNPAAICSNAMTRGDHTADQCRVRPAAPRSAAQSKRAPIPLTADAAAYPGRHRRRDRSDD